MRPDGADQATAKRIRARTAAGGTGSRAPEPVKSPKPMAANATRHIFMVRIFMIRAKAASSEGGTGLVSLDHLAQHIELLVLAAGRFAEPEGDEPRPRGSEWPRM